MYTGAWVNVMVLFADINECVEDPAVCSHQCRNVKGSFKCLCPRGYVLLVDGRTCSGMCSCTGCFCLLVCSVHVSVITSVHICGFGHVILELQIIFLGK